jgi:ParB family chromosome partitioning protein
MNMDARNKLKDIPIERIGPNPENPRIYFRQEELDNLLISVKKHGIQVPISVYQDGDNYVIIDGERRWRTSRKLNLKSIPAIIQAKPNDLENLLMMFNIHSLREQWDLFTIANKITKVIDLLTINLNKVPNEMELSEHTGLNRSTIRRCKLLIELPDKYKESIRKELEIPKSKQKLTEDFFIEMENSLKTVRRNFPEIIDDIDEVRDNLISKYRKGVIKNLVDFRQIGKLATAHKNVQYEPAKSKKALQKVFANNHASIVDVYNSTVGGLYTEKKFISSIEGTILQIENLSPEEREDADVIDSLKRLRTTINKILR